MRKCEDLRNSAVEFELIFKGNEAKLYSDFISNYEVALFCMYKYQIIIDKMKAENAKRPMLLEDAQRLFGEENQRKKLYSSLDELKTAYDAVSEPKIEQKNRKQIC